MGLFGGGCGWITPDDSQVDRLNRVWTSSVLVLCGAVLGSYTFLGTPVKCWCPAYFTTNHEDYTDKTCWSQRTYYAEQPPKENETFSMIQEQIAYYQWVPAVLLCQALMFVLPYIFWRLSCERTPMKLAAIMKSAWIGKYGCCKSDRVALINYLSNSVSSSIRPSGINATRYNRFPLLSILYMLTKVMYVIVCCLQLVMLERVFQWNGYLHGIQTLVDLYHGKEWEVSPVLPRIILCDFAIRQMGNTHKHTVQCTMTLNIVSEWVFLFVWFWISLLLVMNLYSLLHWVKAYMLPCGRRDFLHHLLHSGGKSTITRGPTHHLPPDACLTLALLAENTDGTMASEVACALFEDRPPGDLTVAASGPVEAYVRPKPRAPPVEENIPLYPSLNRRDPYYEEHKKAPITYIDQ